MKTHLTQRFISVALIGLLPLAAWAQPTMVTQPQNTNLATLGAPASFTATASGTLPMFFQWRKNGVTIPGATTNVATSPGTAKLNLASVQPTNAGSYSVVVSNATGVVNSSAALLTLSALPDLNASDAFAAAGNLGSAASGSGRTINTNATSESGEPNHAGIPGGASVWLKWTAPGNGIATFDTRGSAIDTLLAVYTGAAVDSLTPIEGDDDRGGFLNSTVTFNVEAGTTYALAVDGFYGAKGGLVVNWSFTNTTDTVAVITVQPQSRTVAVGSIYPVFMSVTTDPFGPAVAYQWLFNGAPMSNETNNLITLSNISSNNVGNYSVRLVTSGQGLRTNFSATAYLQLNSQDGDVNTSSAARGKFALAMNSGNGTGSYYGQQVFHTAGATKEPGEPPHCGQPGGASYWYAYRAPEDGTLTVDTIGSSFNTVLAIYTGTGSNFATLNPVGCSSTNGGTGGEVVTLSVSNGVRYFIAVDGVNGAQGLVKLNYHCTPTYLTPPVITNQPAGQSVSAGDDVTFCAPATGQPPIYYQWRLNGVNIFDETNSCLYLYSVDPTNGGTYSVVAYNAGGAINSTNVTLLITNVPVFTFTDSYASRSKLPANGAGVRRNDNFNSTREAFEPPNHGGKPGNASVWVKWTAPNNGIVTFDTLGSGYDTTMSVYTNSGSGSNLTTLGLVADGDDDGGGYLCSTVSFNAIDGETYDIAVDGFYGARGYFTLRWQTLVTTDRLPIILLQPKSVTLPPNGSTTFSVNVDTNNPNIQSIEYLWSHNGVDYITSGNGSSLSLANVSSNDVGSYAVKITQTMIGSNNPRTLTSAAAQLQINTLDGSSNPNVIAQYKYRDLADTGSGLNGIRPQIGAPAVGYSGSQLFSTYGAIKEPGEPNHCSEAGGASYWFSYQPPASGTVTVDATSVGFNHLVAVYTAVNITNFTGLTSVGCSSTNLSPGHEVSTFSGTSNIVYYIVTDGVGGTTGTVSLAYSVVAPPAVSGQPGSLTVNQSSNASFSVSATGNPTLKYQWRFNTTNNLLNATNTSLTVTNSQATNGGSYTCVITNSYGSTTSSVATLTVRTAIVISNQPASLVVLAGSNSTFTVVAGGTSPAYRWRFNLTNNLLNATNASLTVTNAQSTNAGSYDVVITNVVNALTSSVATLTVNVPPSLTNQPASQTVVQSSNVSLTVGASGSTPLSYQWRTNGTPFTGRTTTPLTLTNFQSTNEGSYDVIVTNSYGAVTSASASLYLIASNAASRFTNWSFPTNTFVVTLLGSPLSNYAVLTSTNTTNWTAISTNNSVSGIIPLTVTNSQGYSNLLFRARTP
ncbi:MAG: hypothetical protein RL380_1839 [Verrucomicrobiota bacterium]